MPKKVPQIRLFIALGLNKPSEKKLLALIRKLKKPFAGKFYDKDKLHLTLLFLGWVREDKLPLVKKLFLRHALRSHSFVTKVILLELCRRTRARNHLWLRLESERLIDFQEKIASSFQKNKFPLEKRKFLPHLTIARQLTTKKKIKKPLDLKLTFRKIILFKSTLLPQGSRYTKLLSKS